MVLINDKKYACATCIKGHRVSGCTHTDRPLFEVKKKGRPATQCQFCREKRKGGASGSVVHTKCVCGDLKNQTPSTIYPGQAGPSTLPPTQPVTKKSPPTETKKGVPGSTPTFPNGLKDVHDMAAAAEALTGLSGENNRSSERMLQNLLNPCHCRVSGKCICCKPKSAVTQHSPSPPRTDTHAQVTDSLIEMFKTKATTTTPSDCCQSTHNSGSSTPSNGSHPQTTSLTPIRVNLTMTAAHLASPANRHHPSHTSPHVHKTRLYSPYFTGHSSPRQGNTRSNSVSSSSGLSPSWGGSGSSPAVRPPPSRLRGLGDMSALLGAVFKEDGSIANEIPRSALGLPGIDTFDQKAREGGVKVEPMETEDDSDIAVTFPTTEDITMAACTCGDDCQCPGCVLHNGGSQGESSRPHVCGIDCTSRFDCSGHFSIPSGTSSIKQLITVAAANVPPHPPRPNRPYELNAHDTNVLPPAALMSEDTGRAFGVVQLKRLECCNGRCQCPPGECKCESTCCGCCVRCTCDGDGDTIMGDDTQQGQTGTSPRSGCCSSKADGDVSQNYQSCAPKQLPVMGNTLSPSNIMQGESRHPSPQHANGIQSTTPPPGGHIQRSTSVSRAKEATGGRRVSLSNSASGSGIQRSSSVGSKSASKALALHTTPHHPRPILPKPSAAANASNAHGRLTVLRTNSASGNRQRSPSNGHTSSSSQASQSGSPASIPSALPGVQGATAHQENGERPASMAIGVDDIASALAASEVDFMAFFNQLLATGSVDGAGTGSSSTLPSVDIGDIAEPATAGPELTMSDIDASTAVNNDSLTFAHSDLEASMGDIQEIIAGALAEQGLLGPDLNADLLQQQQQQLQQSQQPNTQPGNAPEPQPQPQPQVHRGQPAPNGPDLNYYLDSIRNQGQDRSSAGPSTNMLFYNDMQQFQPDMAPVADTQPMFAASGMTAEQQFFAYGSFEANPFVNNLPQGPTQPQSSQSRNGSIATVNGQLEVLPAPAGVAPINLPPAVVAAASSNPDLIDLSKPLNPGDIDRILQALLTQQARQSEGVAARVGEGPSGPPVSQGGVNNSVPTPVLQQPAVSQGPSAGDLAFQRWMS